jgi:hypothetical protein
VLACLREQRAAATIVSRELSGVGFFVDFQVPDSAPLCGTKPDFTLTDVEATMAGLAHGAGFVLFVREGRITMLEGFCYDESWPDTLGDFQLRYDPVPRDLSVLE